MVSHLRQLYNQILEILSRERRNHAKKSIFDLAFLYRSQSRLHLSYVHG